MLPAWLGKKSHFLFGPRQTGKSAWIRHALPEARVYDLLDSAVYLALSQRPSRLAEELSTKDKEVDFILGDHTAIEVKAKEIVSDRDLRSLRALAEEKNLKRYVCVSLAPRLRRVNDVTVRRYRETLGRPRA